MICGVHDQNNCWMEIITQVNTASRQLKYHKGLTVATKHANNKSPLIIKKLKLLDGNICRSYTFMRMIFLNFVYLYRKFFGLQYIIPGIRFPFSLIFSFIESNIAGIIAENIIAVLHIFDCLFLCIMVIFIRSSRIKRDYCSKEI